MHQEPDRGAEGDPVFHSGEDGDQILLVSGRSQLALPRTAPVELGLDVGLAQLKPGRTAVDNRPDRRTVALSKGGDPEYGAENR